MPGLSIHISQRLFGDLDFDVCNDEGRRQRLASVLDVPCPVKPGMNVTGNFCFTVPLSAIVHATERVEVQVTWVDGSASQLACYQAALPIAGDLDIDFHVEATAAQARLRLRRALSEGGAGTGEAVSAAVRPLLNAAYEAQPEWAEAFSAWRQMHSKEWASPASEAAAYQAFRENVLAVVRAGRPINLDERFDLRADARRTLSHFG